MSESRGVGGATFLASVATGIVATLCIFTHFTIQTNGFPADISQFLAVGTLGAAVGLLLIWPFCLIVTFFGLGLMESHGWTASRWAWGASGAAIGTLPLVALALATFGLPPGDLVTTILYGAIPGAFAGTLTHRLLLPAKPMDPHGLPN